MIKVNGVEVDAPMYAYLECETEGCGNVLAVPAVPGWAVNIVSLKGLRWMCLNCGKQYGTNEWYKLEKPTQVEEVIVESEDNKNDE